LFGWALFFILLRLMMKVNSSIYLILLFLLTLNHCAPVVPHTGCYIADAELNGLYKGECRNRKAEGFGKAIGRDTYTGYFREGVIDGSGKYVWSDGSYYLGQFKQGQMHGRGVFFESNGVRSKDGFWEEGNFVKSLR
jgi:hypothetical protein